MSKLASVALLFLGACAQQTRSPGSARRRIHVALLAWATALLLVAWLAIRPDGQGRSLAAKTAARETTAGTTLHDILFPEENAR